MSEQNTTGFSATIIHQLHHELRTLQLDVLQIDRTLLLALARLEKRVDAIETTKQGKGTIGAIK